MLCARRLFETMTHPDGHSRPLHLSFGQCLGSAAREGLGGRDDQLDRNEKMELGTRAMQNCDSASHVMAGETRSVRARLTRSVVAGLVPAIHVLLVEMP